MRTIRNRFWRKERIEMWNNLTYKRKSFYGLLRGKWNIFLGRIEHTASETPLILGNNIHYDMGENSHIVTLNNPNSKYKTDSYNTLHHNAISIGVEPHWSFINPPVAHCTRLRIREKAKLILEPNTTILLGGYIAIWPTKTLSIGRDSYLAHNVHINTKCGLSIGENVIIGHNTTIMDYDGHPIYPTGIEINQNCYGGTAKKITIQDHVWIGFGATILKGVTIGTGAVIGANACITSDVPPNSIVAGNPARIIKENIKWKMF